MSETRKNVWLNPVRIDRALDERLDWAMKLLGKKQSEVIRYTLATGFEAMEAIFDTPKMKFGPVESAFDKLNLDEKETVIHSLLSKIGDEEIARLRKQKKFIEAKEKLAELGITQAMIIALGLESISGYSSIKYRADVVLDVLLNPNTRFGRSDHATLPEAFWRYREEIIQKNHNGVKTQAA